VKFLAALLILTFRCTPGTTGEIGRHLENCEIANQFSDLEELAQTASLEEQPAILKSFASNFVGTTLHIDSGIVTTKYERDWLTRPYFSLNYDREEYIYLEEIDPTFQEELSDHEFWASVATMCPGRQLMFELALDEPSFEAIRGQQRISFSCKAAAVIRGGKSVYCSLISIKNE
jgi:hypothetical protein